MEKTLPNEPITKTAKPSRLVNEEIRALKEKPRTKREHNKRYRKRGDPFSK